MRTALVAVLVAVSLAASGCADSADTPPQLGDLAGSGLPTGERAPGFSLTTFGGTEFILSEHLAADGRPLFLNLWASWCGPCRAEMPDIDEAAAANADVAFLGVAVQDTLGKAEEFAEEIAVSYPLAFDETGEVDAGYAPLGLPASYIISAEGLIVERIFGPLTRDQIEEKLAGHFG